MSVMGTWLILLQSARAPAVAEPVNTKDFWSLTGIASILWPLITLFVLWKFWPSLKTVIESKSFAVEILGVKLSVGDATNKLQSQIEDLQLEFLKLKAGSEPSPRTGDKAPGSQKTAPESVAPVPPASARILWVDDNPDGNKLEAARLRKNGFVLDQSLSTDEALGELAAQTYQLVISDMGRQEGAHWRSDAGLRLLNLMREREISVPVVFYTSSKTAAKYKEKVQTSGGRGITSSLLELFEFIQQISGKPLHQ